MDTFKSIHSDFTSTFIYTVEKCCIFWVNRKMASYLFYRMGRNIVLLRSDIRKICT